MDGMGPMALIGGFVLVIFLIFGIVSNRRRSRSQVGRTEEGTKDLYARIDRREGATDPK